MIVYTPPQAATSIPVIDLADSFSADPAARTAVAWEIHKAARDTGFFYITNHGVPQDMLDSLLTTSAKFFSLPLPDKLTADIHTSSAYRGYEPIAVQTLDAGSRPDNKEGFQIGRDLPADHPKVRRGVANHGPNLWPDNMPELRTEIEAYRDRMADLGKHLVRLLALSLDQPEDYFDPGFDEHVITTRLLHYPPQDGVGEGNALGAGAHTDWGMITMLLQDQVGGLEVLNADGHWIRAPHIPGTFVVNLGDLVPILTNGLYRSNTHRVLNTADVDRYSVPTFFDLDYDYLVTPVATTLAQGEPAGPGVTVGEHLADMLRRTYTAVAATP
ncbi:isopenicillin N synthase family dioxygenase [Gordonia polyisoprenivorans]|uniref:isopenicillin N synthase family dioxygenase n=1 Tax=Gordonia polyisoprenivorans TaxID=84595 RepID=UPI000B99E6BF|nr:2-oxoglutarate and iron-dependent oxygenase domain-containing protein [Gordonia polyisoprenivorans]OZC33578.1 penicillin synthase [Gordonia polyisoprenivorans]UZF56994.1 isopenicillin N synthase family oxygenase [Gordonia polyisoprenivorans]